MGRVAEGIWTDGMKEDIWAGRAVVEIMAVEIWVDGIDEGVWAGEVNIGVRVPFCFGF